MKKLRTYSRYAKEAASLLGEQIKLGRKQIKWSEKTFSERVGVSRTTLHKIEAGDMTVALGIVLEAAAIVGVPLFVEENPSITRSLNETREKVALLPKRIKAKQRVVKDEF